MLDDPMPNDPKYPLWCYDTGDRHSEDRYFVMSEAGAKDEAEGMSSVHPGGRAVPCRRLSFSEAFGRDFVARRIKDFVESMDEDVGGGEANVPDGAFGRWDDSMFQSNDAFEGAVIEALDRHVKPFVWICKGDEEPPDHDTLPLSPGGE